MLVFSYTECIFTLIVLSAEPDTILSSSNCTHSTAASCPLKESQVSCKKCDNYEACHLTGETLTSPRHVNC